MSSITRKQDASPIAPQMQKEMEKYGIVRVPVDNFYFGAFRYTNLDDAIAYAKRNPRSGGAE